MPNNLIPTPITDKNGKPTTVHKKPVGSSTAGASSIPAPSLSKSKSLPAENPADPGRWAAGDPVLSHRFYGLMIANNGGRDLGMDKTVFVTTTVDRQRKLFCELLERKDGFGDIISAGTSPSLPDNRKPGSKLLEAIGLVYDKDLFNEFPESYKKLTKARKSFLKLDGYKKALTSASFNMFVDMDRKEISTLGEQSPEKIEKVRAYVKLYAAVRATGSESEDLEPELASFALRGDYPVDDVVAVIRKHQTSDLNTIAGILNGALPSIAEGWL